MRAAAHVGFTPVSESPVPPRITLLRTGIGLLQGLVLYLLYLVADYDVWPAIEHLLFAPLLLMVLLCPVLLVSALGHLTRRQLLLWVGGAALLIAALAVYDIWRMGTQLNLERHSHVAMPSPALCFVLVIGLFIAHALVLSGARDRRRIAAYTTYFDIAWKLGVQLAFSAFFVGITWLALTLGAELFRLVKLTFFAELIHKPWFAIPVTAFAFACALHLTDVRPAIVQGIRGLLLMLASWILPVFAFFVAGFLASLPFTGLEPLWGTRQAASVLLGTDAVLVVLINAAWQNGSTVVARVIRLSARVAAVLLVPVTSIAIYALALRVGDHGWTDERIVAAACMLVASCYALGYAAAALRRGWLSTLAGVNIDTAFVVLALVLLLFSPLLDPARLSVNSQLARLASGEIKADRFDFAYLRFSGQRFGFEALARLEATATGQDAKLVRERIGTVRKMTGAWDRPEKSLPPTARIANLRAQPPGVPLPTGLLNTDWEGTYNKFRDPECFSKADRPCNVYLLDVTNDGKAEALIVDVSNGRTLVVQENADGRWLPLATTNLETESCAQLRDMLPGHVPHTVTPQLSDLEFAGVRLRLYPIKHAEFNCHRR